MRALSLSLALFTAAWSFAADSSLQRGEPLRRKGVLGIQLAAPTADELKAANLTASVKAAGVLPGLTGEALKVLPGDLLVSINGKAIASNADIGAAIRPLFGGDSLTVVVKRNGNDVTLTGKLMERPKQKLDGHTVVYDQVMSKGKRIRLIATHPSTTGPHPTVFLIGGIGAYSVDGDYTSIPYGKVLEPVAKAGYAIVRIDKPGQGDSEGPAYPELTFDDELDAYVQALRYAKTLPFVNKDKIAIFGHSMGGTFGPLLASQEKVAGISVGGTLAKTWFEYVIENTRRQSLLAGATPAQVDEALRDDFVLNHYLYNEGLSPQEIITKYPKLEAQMKAMSPDMKTYSGVGFPFFQQLAKKNIMDAWAKTDAKVMIFYSENDFLAGRSDHDFIVDTINKAKPGQAELKILTNSDHGFNTTTSPLDSMQKWGRPVVHNSNIEVSLIEWLNRVLKG